jgi:hypothetical protein
VRQRKTSRGQTVTRTQVFSLETGKDMRRLLIGLWMSCCVVSAASAQVSVGLGISLPGVSIGIHLPAYPQLVRVPGYPVYYAPQVESNFFFYDGMYWVYEDDRWYASSWYNGPWGLVDPQVVPLFVLRIPVRYYRSPPPYFRPWRADAPPRWGEHWGGDWERNRSGWDRWNHRSAPAPAPLPTYQRRYSQDRYPQHIEQQQQLHNQNYRYQPRDSAVRQAQPAQREPQPRQERQQQPERQQPPQQRQQPQERQQRPEPPQRQQPQPPERQQPHDRGQGQGQDHGKDRDRGDGRGQ